MKKAPISLMPFQNIQAFLDGTRGQITICEIPPNPRAALAAEGKKARVALVCRDGETVAQLLARLDSALGKTMAEDTTVDEVLSEIKRRRSRKEAVLLPSLHSFVERQLKFPGSRPHAYIVPLITRCTFNEEPRTIEGLTPAFRHYPNSSRQDRVTPRVGRR